jgi:hypothetical protein
MADYGIKSRGSGPKEISARVLAERVSVRDPLDREDVREARKLLDQAV